MLKGVEIHWGSSRRTVSIASIHDESTRVWIKFPPIPDCISRLALTSPEAASATPIHYGAFEVLPEYPVASGIVL